MKGQEQMDTQQMQDDKHELITLAEASEYGNYRDTSALRQAIKRGKMKGELRREGPFIYYLTTRAWVDEYIRNRPEWHQDYRRDLIESEK